MKSFNIVCKPEEVNEVRNILKQCDITQIESSGYGSQIYIAVSCTEKQAETYNQIIDNLFKYARGV